VMSAEVNQIRAYRALAETITAGTPDAAYAAAENLLKPATDAFLDAIRKLEDA
jgi:DNA-binding FadR family transcriptional regulator